MVPLTLATRTPLPKHRRRVGRHRRHRRHPSRIQLRAALLGHADSFRPGLTAVLQSITPAFALVFAHFLLPDEKMTLRKLGGLALGVAGITVIFWDQLHFGGRAFTGSVTVTLGRSLRRFRLRHRPAFWRKTSIRAQSRLARCSSAFVPLLLYAWVVEGNPTEIRWTSTALRSRRPISRLLGSVVAAWLNYWLLARVGAVNLLIMGLVEPPIAVLLGAWILDETMNARAAIGSALILVSVWLAMGGGPKAGRLKPAPTEPASTESPR